MEPILSIITRTGQGRKGAPASPPYSREVSSNKSLSKKREERGRTKHRGRAKKKSREGTTINYDIPEKGKGSKTAANARGKKRGSASASKKQRKGRRQEERAKKGVYLIELLQKGGVLFHPLRRKKERRLNLSGDAVFGEREG